MIIIIANYGDPACDQFFLLTNIYVDSPYVYAPPQTEARVSECIAFLVALQRFEALDKNDNVTRVEITRLLLQDSTIYLDGIL